MEKTDREILDLFLARAEDAIEALRVKYGRLCQRIAMNILHSAEDAEECASDTYMAVWETVPPREPDPLMPYVGRLARNFALDRYRYLHAARRSGGGDVLLSEIEEIVSGTDGAEDEAMRGALAAAISRFLREQKADDRRLFVRRYWYGDDVQSLSREMGIRAGSAAVRLHRMRERLRVFLENEGFSV
ncbi:MAG: sigma-70 family RNA polymerase sigma factor [Ruminococcaceae bacterium]|nr:sigma-70 family RNA polymerase sigma factor [Oscillospiraceae bacterium]